jgi:hypothetical protein
LTEGKNLVFSKMNNFRSNKVESKNGYRLALHQMSLELHNKQTSDSLLVEANSNGLQARHERTLYNNVRHMNSIIAQHSMNTNDDPSIARLQLQSHLQQKSAHLQSTEKIPQIFPNRLQRMIPLAISNHTILYDMQLQDLTPSQYQEKKVTRASNLAVRNACSNGLTYSKTSLLRSFYLHEASRLLHIESSSDISTVPSELLSIGTCYADNSIASLVTKNVSSKSGTKLIDVSPKLTLTGRHPITVYLTQDENVLSEYQCFVRQQIEFFEADLVDIETNAKGRNNPIALGQVGIRCRHCAALPPKYRSRGAMYYPTKLNLIYQAAQNMTKIHLRTRCKNAPEAILRDLMTFRQCKSGTGGGKIYWNEGAQLKGIREVGECLRFAPNESDPAM